MKIGIWGAGNIGGTLGKKWALAGHDVLFGVRHPSDEKYADLRQAEGNISLVSMEAALDGVDLLVIAVAGTAVSGLAQTYADQLNQINIIMDATNQIGQPVMNSLETLAAHAPDAKLIRAFNNLGWENFAQPTYGEDQVALFYCGDPVIREISDQLIADVGLQPIYVGGRETAQQVDSLTALWFSLAFQQGYGRRVALKLLHEKQ